MWWKVNRTLRVKLSHASENNRLWNMRRVIREWLADTCRVIDARRHARMWYNVLILVIWWVFSPRVGMRLVFWLVQNNFYYYLQSKKATNLRVVVVKIVQQRKGQILKKVGKSSFGKKCKMHELVPMASNFQVSVLWPLKTAIGFQFSFLYFSSILFFQKR